MDVLDRIKRFLDEEGVYPWQPGFNKNSNASKEATVAWKMLSIQERLAISKNNIFVNGRNSVLLDLWLSGFRQELLAELSGLSVITVQRVCKKGLKNE
jgi:hypothetical protein